MGAFPFDVFRLLRIPAAAWEAAPKPSSDRVRSPVIRETARHRGAWGCEGRHVSRSPIRARTGVQAAEFLLRRHQSGLQRHRSVRSGGGGASASWPDGSSTA